MQENPYLKFYEQLSIAENLPQSEEFKQQTLDRLTKVVQLELTRLKAAYYSPVEMKFGEKVARIIYAHLQSLTNRPHLLVRLPEIAGLGVGDAISLSNGEDYIVETCEILDAIGRPSPQGGDLARLMLAKASPQTPAHLDVPV